MARTELPTGCIAFSALCDISTEGTGVVSRYGQVSGQVFNWIRRVRHRGRAGKKQIRLHAMPAASQRRAVNGDLTSVACLIDLH